MVTVRGKNILEKPLLESDEVSSIVIRTADGRALLLIAHIRGDTWGVSSAEDNDWKPVLERFGVKEYEN